MVNQTVIAVGIFLWSPGSVLGLAVPPPWPLFRPRGEYRQPITTPHLLWLGCLPRISWPEHDTGEPLAAELDPLT